MSKYKIVKNNTQIHLQLDGKNLLTFNIDPHDNRLVGTGSLEALHALGDEQDAAIADFANFLKDNFGAKQFLVCDEGLAKSFSSHGFSVDLSPPSTARVRVTSPKELQFKKGSELKAEGLKNFEQLSISWLPHAQKYTQKILQLMEGSGFSPGKIKDYLTKGADGILVMAENAQLFGLFDEHNELVGLCRVGSLGNQGDLRLGYLSDSLIDFKRFSQGESEQDKIRAFECGTAWLYHEVSKIISKQYDQLLLIAPPDREQEFSTNFGCKVPAESLNFKPKVLCRFGGPQQELKSTYEACKDQACKEVAAKKLTAIKANKAALFGTFLVSAGIVAAKVVKAVITASNTQTPRP